jgi:hypothetical protein
MNPPEEGVAVHAPASEEVPDPAEVPSTGDRTIDEALQGLHDLPLTPLAEHHDRLAQVHEALHVALERSGDEPDPS